ncbi:MAG: RNase adapter RapZ [Gammaproteobacteria bacterium]|nr:RNase adapter RapZ [Gammaproteobacteria bacterium]
MKLVIISGRSGSGKSTALHVLEDAGYTAIDNLPVGLLPALVHNALRVSAERTQRMAVSIDARNSAADLQRFPEILLSLDRMDLDCEVVYLDALGPTLVKRFSETRRRHPLTNQAMDLRQAIEAERELLTSIADLADLTIDTTQLTTPGLVDLIKARVTARTERGISLLFRSFGFKFGVPVDGDLVYDIRCLPNPHWVPELRTLTGRDTLVQQFLDGDPDVRAMYEDIKGFLQTWLPKYEENNRIYMTVAIGCTGGQHRSVYMTELLGEHFRKSLTNVLVRHRELEFRAQ